MILYSIIPPEVVFKGYSENDDLAGKSPGIMEASYRGERVLVRRSADRRYELVRLLSTCPEIFLKDEFQPGHIIEEEELKMKI